MRRHFKTHPETTTWSLVARFPEDVLFELPAGADLQFHYGESENFNPVGARNNSLGQAIAQPTGTTKEYGFLLSLREQKYSLRVNWFETSLEKQGGGGLARVDNWSRQKINNYLDAEREGINFSDTMVLLDDPDSHPIQSYQQFYDAFVGAIPSDLAAVINPRFESDGLDGLNYEIDPILNLSGARDRVAEGFELELVANPSDNWRLSMNVGRQETVQSNTSPVNAALAEEFTRNLETAGLIDFVSDASGIQVTRPLEEEWSTVELSDIRSARAFDGTVSNEQREWRVAGVSRYSFKEGRFKGLSLGGSGRWQSGAATGYIFILEEETNVPIPDVNRPFEDDGLFSGDVFFSYRKKIFKDVDWTIRLNIKNVIGDDDDVVVKTNPDGRVAVIRAAPPSKWTLSNSFSF